MAENFLAPLGVYTTIGAFCGVKNVDSEDFRFAVQAACDEVVGKCGPVLTETLTVNVRTDVAEVVLPARVASIVSVTPTGGAALPVGDFYAQGQVLCRADGGAIPAGVVVVTSGWEQSAIPRELVFAGSLLARHMWRTQLGNQRTPENDSAGTGTTAWLWPTQARELARPYMLAPLGFA